MLLNTTPGRLEGGDNSGAIKNRGIQQLF